MALCRGVALCPWRGAVAWTEFCVILCALNSTMFNSKDVYDRGMQSMSQRTMAACCVLGVAAIIFTQSGLADAVPAAPRPIALKAARLFDAVSGKLTEHGVLVVSGTKIQAVGGDVRIPENAQVIDLGDATLLPGFIDCQVHLSHEAVSSW